MTHLSDKSLPAAAARAVGGKTARACDSCIRCRARWYCAADDAFLCHPCDTLVHSANPLARRHHRLRLRSFPATLAAAPAWHHGFKRKARTPRSHHKPVVPELESLVDEEEEEEEQLLYRVPVFDNSLTFGNTPPPPYPPPTASVAEEAIETTFTQPDMELAEFAANMESLLGRELDGGEAFCMEELGLGESGDRRQEIEIKGEVEKAEKEEDLCFEMEVDLSREALELDFGCGSPEMMEETAAVKDEEIGGRGMGLRLDYEAVKEAWLVNGCSPWISGERPRLAADNYWLECLGMWGGELVVGGGIQVTDVGREARVTRYREKRRSRLFSKKIRYEVRKLNAEKRPRMKGRFVKRSSFPTKTDGASTGGGQVALNY